VLIQKEITNVFRPQIQKKQILAGTLTADFSINSGSDYPENVWAFFTYSAMSGSETLNVHGKPPGLTGVVSAVLVTQIDVKAAESTKTRLNLSTFGPLDEVRFTATNIAAAETIDIVIISW
jgi:hypothetical protein